MMAAQSKLSDRQQKKYFITVNEATLIGDCQVNVWNITAYLSDASLYFLKHSYVIKW